VRKNLWEVKTSRTTLARARQRLVRKRTSWGIRMRKREEFIMPADQMRGPKGLGDEIDPVEKKGEPKIRVNR